MEYLHTVICTCTAVEFPLDFTGRSQSQLVVGKHLRPMRSFPGKIGVARYMTREEAAFLSRRPSCTNQRTSATLSTLLCYSSQRLISPDSLWVGAACQTTARKVGCGGGCLLAG